jgi:lysyl-tRNA synthetase class II
MAANFKISVHRSSESLHLKLMGDFDGSSACELINVVKKNANGNCRVFIHTNCLKSIHPFDSVTFRQNLSEMKRRSFHILFTGEHASEIAPEKNSCH